MLTPASKGVGGALAKAEAIVAEIGENAFMLQQFVNPDNPKVCSCMAISLCTLGNMQHEFI